MSVLRSSGKGALPVLVTEVVSTREEGALDRPELWRTLTREVRLLTLREGQEFEAASAAIAGVHLEKEEHRARWKSACISRRSHRVLRESLAPELGLEGGMPKARGYNVDPLINTVYEGACCSIRTVYEGV